MNLAYQQCSWVFAHHTRHAAHEGGVPAYPPSLTHDNSITTNRPEKLMGRPPRSAALYVVSALFSCLNLQSLAQSSSSLPDAPGTVIPPQPTAIYRTAIRPFSALGIDAKVGANGIGFDVATPLAPKLNLRGGASFFGYTVDNLVEDGFNIKGNLTLRSVNASVDWFPFSNGFRISPGIMLYNGNRFHGTATVPAGSTITLNNTDYTSDPSDPLVATFDSPNNRFGNRVGPTITTGWGNIIPRSGKHWSVPFEIGFEYISPPKINLGLTGSACSADGCGNVQTDAETQANVQAQQAIINDDIHNLRFFPILSIGVGYKF